MISSGTSLALFLTSFSTSALAAVVSADIHITNAVLAPDGFSRDTVVAGGVFPAPLIKGNMGDEFQLNVFDDLTDSDMDLATSIHWHGFFQKTTNYADGVSFVTQCPLIPGNSYLYDFSVPDQAGTYWYHSHFKNQYCDGLRGPFVVYDPNDPQASLYDVDDDSTVITLADWYHYLSTNAPSIPQPTSGLINGVGRYSGATTNPDLAVVGVTAGKRYRFRVINIACDSYFVFSIDGHQLTIIEADGVSTQPLVVDTLQILAGQRYSVVLNANQSPDNYWIRSIPARGSTTGGLNSAILRYDGANVTDPTTSAPTSPLALVETNLHCSNSDCLPLQPGDPTPGGADININLAVTNVNGTFYVNNQTFTPPSVPVLLQILSGASNASDLLPSSSIYSLQPNKVVELTIPGGAPGGPHPLHLHGHTFYVVRSAGNATYNWDNPIIRDVVSTGTTTSDQTTIRFVTDNPGPWFLHCHIDWHLNEGFAVVFAEDTGDVTTADPAPDAWKALCPAYDSFISS
ncbi:multicopper oxidase [Auriscalpium vulgare]|uniref:Multicopper oxidase n=1 Tax=Auriscalpium vulgare TaxID=40419 RepID=A0ACB8REF5_9AGAM|nr:multicopper oxidase [Auriscalpium vulgare]